MARSKGGPRGGGGDSINEQSERTDLTPIVFVALGAHISFFTLVHTRTHNGSVVVASLQKSMDADSYILA